MQQKEIAIVSTTCLTTKHNYDLGTKGKKINKDAIALLRECRSCPQTPVFLGKGLHGMDIISMPTAVEVEKKEDFF